MLRALLLSLAGVAGLSAVSMPAFAQTPPRAAQHPHTHTAHGVSRDDPYYWLRDRDDPAVIAYLAAENAYTEAVTAPTAALRETLYAELAARVAPDDASAPVYNRGYWYVRRYEAGREYPVYARHRGSLGAPEEILLDANERAAGHGYYQMGGYRITDDGRTMAFAEDTVGRRQYTIRFKDLATGAILPDAVGPVTPSMTWAGDGRTLFVARQDPETLRSYQVLRYTLGQSGPPAVAYEEADDTFGVYVTASKDRRFVLVVSDQTLTSEWRYLDAATPTAAFRVVRPRERGVEYSAEHAGGQWIVRTNLAGPDGPATNFRLMRAPTDRPDAWTEIVGHRADVLLEGVDVFAGHLVTQERAGGVRRLLVRAPDGAVQSEVAFAESAYNAELAGTPDPDAPTFRFTYESLTTPEQTIDVAFADGARTVVRTQPVPTYDASQYVTERRWITARDGVRVPLSVVRRADTLLDGSAPLLLYGYGSYGISMEAWFDAEVISLLDRGFVYAVAHVRGGQEMGRAWYDAGKLSVKMTTFTDFIDAADALATEGLVDPDRIFAEGGSAGGLLVGAVLNLRPDRWAGVVAHVPFVDVVTTMLDDSIPLTTGEYDEWGNPNEEAAFRTMLAYSPYDNVRATRYPAVLVTTGLHDSQVQYWEPAKWVARLRERTTGDAPILLKTEMEAGHGGPSGRFRRLRENAFVHAWLLERAGLAR